MESISGENLHASRFLSNEDPRRIKNAYTAGHLRMLDARAARVGLDDPQAQRALSKDLQQILTVLSRPSRKFKGVNFFNFNNDGVSIQGSITEGSTKFFYTDKKTGKLHLVEGVRNDENGDYGFYLHTPRVGAVSAHAGHLDELYRQLVPVVGRESPRDKSRPDTFSQRDAEGNNSGFRYYDRFGRLNFYTVGESYTPNRKNEYGSDKTPVSSGYAATSRLFRWLTGDYIDQQPAPDTQYHNGSSRVLMADTGRMTGDPDPQNWSKDFADHSSRIWIPDSPVMTYPFRNDTVPLGSQIAPLPRRYFDMSAASSYQPKTDQLATRPAAPTEPIRAPKVVTIMPTISSDRRSDAYALRREGVGSGRRTFQQAFAERQQAAPPVISEPQGSDGLSRVSRIRPLPPAKGEVIDPSATSGDPTPRKEGRRPASISLSKPL